MASLRDLPYRPKMKPLLPKLDPSVPRRVPLAAVIGFLVTPAVAAESAAGALAGAAGVGRAAAAARRLEECSSSISDLMAKNRVREQLPLIFAEIVL